MIVSTPTYTPLMNLTFDWFLLESDTLTGPFRLVQYLRGFGPQAYFLNIVSKFADTSCSVDEAGNTVYEFWILYSANWAPQFQNEQGYPLGSAYRPCFAKFRIVLTHGHCGQISVH